MLKWCSGAVAVGELWNCRERQPATQHALQPLHSPLHWAQVGSDEPSIVRKAHPLGFSWPADSPTWHTVLRLVVYLRCFLGLLQWRSGVSQLIAVCLACVAARLRRSGFNFGLWQVNYDIKRLISRAGTEGSRVLLFSSICDRCLVLVLEMLSISHCLNH